jgi:hypothetical protein
MDQVLSTPNMAHPQRVFYAVAIGKIGQVFDDVESVCCPHLNVAVYMPT